MKAGFALSLCTDTVHCEYSFSALTLLVGWQEGHLACRNSCTSSTQMYL